MTLQLGLWAIPTLISVALLVWTALTPEQKPTGHMFDYGNMFTFMFRATLTIMGILFVWLVYFALMYWLS
jgi:hypothetical protein